MHRRSACTEWRRWLLPYRFLLCDKFHRSPARAAEGMNTNLGCDHELIVHEMLQTSPNNSAGDRDGCDTEIISIIIMVAILSFCCLRVVVEWLQSHSPAIEVITEFDIEELRTMVMQTRANQGVFVAELLHAPNARRLSASRHFPRPFP